MAEGTENLAELNEQLQVVLDALAEDPENAELLEAKDGLLEVIKLAEQVSNKPAVPQQQQPVASSVATEEGPVTTVGQPTPLSDPSPPRQTAAADFTQQADRKRSSVGGFSSLPVDELLGAGTKCEALHPKEGRWFNAVVLKVDSNGYLIEFGGKEAPQLLSFEKVRPIKGRELKRPSGLVATDGDASLAPPPAKLAPKEIPKSLQILPTDSAEVAERKKRKAHAIKTQQHREKVEAEMASKQQGWQSFLQKRSTPTARVGVPEAKRQSIFRSPDNLDGKVGVTGSGKGMSSATGGAREKWKFSLQQPQPPK